MRCLEVAHLCVCHKPAGHHVEDGEAAVHVCGLDGCQGQWLGRFDTESCVIVIPPIDFAKLLKGVAVSPEYAVPVEEQKPKRDKSNHTPNRSIRVPPALWAQVRAKAEANGTTVAEVTKAFYEEYVEEGVE